MNMADLKNLNLQDLVDGVNNLDFENVGGWPTPVKMVTAVFVFVLVIALGYFAMVTSLNSELSSLEHKETQLMQEYENKSFKAQNLGQYRKQLKDMEESFGSLLKQLPKDTEVPGLLEDITHTGLGSGLEFEKIQLGKETEKQFYAELPIDIVVRGDYHAFGSFVSGVASLPRIVTLHDFDIKPVHPGEQTPGQPGLLEMSITAKTYRYAGGDDGMSKSKGKR